MTNRSHRYEVGLEWTGAGPSGTTAYTAYARSYTILLAGKPGLEGSSDPVYRGDSAKVNPEEMLVASLAACHMLWYLHLCADRGVVVTQYADSATGVLELDRETGGRFIEVVLRPRITLLRGDIQLAESLHEEARRKCFIANSVNFPVRHEPRVTVESDRPPPLGNGREAVPETRPI